ncbi:MAG: hypothetical protein CM15mP92_1670 [Halieaceae bacterium]|nr:MAG: hypothetical protein CM15mP92_1670 [Halieaceae bacterium]
MLVVVVRDGLGMPGDIFGALPEKIVLAPGGPESFSSSSRKPGIPSVSGTAFGFLNDLFPIEGII